MKIHQIFVQIIQFVNKLIFIITRRRRLDDQLYWQFFIHPKDLEALLNKPGNFMNKIPPFGLTLPPFTSHFLILPYPLFKTFFFQIFLHLNKFWYFFSNFKYGACFKIISLVGKEVGVCLFKISYRISHGTWQLVNSFERLLSFSLYCIRY